MYWADEFADQIIKSGKYTPYWIDDMKTPSGRVHIGSVRAVLSHNLVYRALVDRGVGATFTYVLEDHDPMDGLPVYLDKDKFEPHLGEPLFMIPSPDPGYESFGNRWGEEYIEIFNMVGAKPKVIWGSQLYFSGKMNEMVKVCLDKSQIIREIYKEMYGTAKPDDWYPFSAVCEQCGKMSTTNTYDWDGENISYECRVDGLKWTKGCGYKGEKSPFSSKDNYAGKLPWKVEWPCKWKVIGVTVEGAGKDHMTAGGSHDVAKLICERVIDYPVPFHFSHEFFLVGGHKMSSSKGLGSSAKEVVEIIPAFLVRFMIARVKYNRAINFDPSGDTIPDLYDAWDEASQAYWSDPKSQLGRIFELSQVSGKPPSRHFQPRFRDIARIIQDPRIQVETEIEKIKGGKLTTDEKDILDKRIIVAKKWLMDYAPQEQVFEITKNVPPEAVGLSNEQKGYLLAVTKLLDKSWDNPEELQQALYDLSKETGLKPKDAFGAIYASLLGKTHGPKAAWLLVENKDRAVERFEEVQRYEYEMEEEKVAFRFDVITDSFVSIDESISNAYPDIKIAMVVIKGVDNVTVTDKFSAYRQRSLEELAGVTLHEINSSKKIASYRRAIRESGIDWHKRRPTMEALLRRMTQGKGIEWINPLVDIGNIMAMKHQASQGVFDLDQINKPVVMRKSSGGENVLMIGDKEPIELQNGEICYFDQDGPFIVDLCWRDAIRTGATDKTKNVLFLSEAVYDITRQDLEEVLDDLISTVTKYLGGKVLQKGILLASEVK